MQITDWACEEIHFENKVITLDFIEKYIDEYAYETKRLLPPPPRKLVNSWKYHSKRFFMSLKYIVEYELYKGKVFEAGGESIFTNFLRTLLCMDDIAHSKTDLRQPLDLQQKYDAIICMEVFEHINDINLYHNFQFEGIKRMLGSFWKILNPNGKIFITTPNITGIVSIYRILQGKHPMMHTVHVREYTPDELRIITTSLGFEIDLLTTEYIFKGYMVEPAHNALKLAHMPETLRGDDIVLILRKPDGVSFNDDINLAALLA